MIERLLTSNTIATLERTLSFTEQRHAMLLENIANVSTPGYIQKDVPAAEFQRALQDAMAQRRYGEPGGAMPESTETIAFEPHSTRVRLTPREIVNTTPMHDRGIRSMEYLMGQVADNGQAHNMAASFLKSKYDGLARAISMKV